MQQFLNIIAIIFVGYVILEIYQNRKFLLIVGILAVSGYLGYVVYDKQKQLERSALELRTKTDELTQIKQTLANEEFNATGSLGYSLNNPGNIRTNGTMYKGEVKSNADFKKFKSMKYGFRAMTYLLHTYIRNNHNTVEKILTRYAPASDGNNPRAYTNSVIKLANVKPYQELTTADFKNGNMLNIIYAMTRVEQGYSPNIHDLHEGYTMYLNEINIDLQ